MGLFENYKSGLHDLLRETDYAPPYVEDLLDQQRELLAAVDHPMNDDEYGMAKDAARQIMEYSAAEVIGPSMSCLHHCGSPIERMFLMAFLVSFKRICTRLSTAYVFPAGASHGAPFAADTLTIEPQCQIGNYRVDFRFTVCRIRENVRTQRAMVVECDGHDFHEKTKEQAAKDKSRDRELQLAGMSVFRFSGHEIFTNPIKCGRQALAHLMNAE